MSKRSLVLVAAVVLFGSLGQTSAHNGVTNFDDHWLAAACSETPPAANGGRLVGAIVDTDFGPAVTFHPFRAGTVVLYCNIEADLFHNWLQIVAEDNSPNASVTATIYRQAVIGGPLAAPEVVATLTTTDQPGVAVTSLFIEPALEFSEFAYMYYLKIEIFRANRTIPVAVLSVSLLDVL